VTSSKAEQERDAHGGGRREEEAAHQEVVVPTIPDERRG